ncbi:hypothetical protein C8A05DRAFT_39280 [Staphylotrichum tortipilum]|uniref:Uncharacterized protein n=1 Tax=Staphylotrichum tortipilum TaxID=2831512 RepID=A0AAN6MB56_9PEZI|nr:hypothetical protein C8A05DRAFT_39280 [Staphylotrichum longicolle]
MDPHFLRDVETAHRLECQNYWGPSFASGVRALVALGELLLVAANEPELAAIEIEPTSTRLGNSTNWQVPGKPTARRPQQTQFEAPRDCMHRIGCHVRAYAGSSCI